MNLRASTQRILQELEPSRDGECSATWPTAAELYRGHESVAPASGHSRFDEPFRGDLAEFFEPNDSDTLRVFAELDRHDTIPSPPPELDSAPWHDER